MFSSIIFSVCLLHAAHGGNLLVFHLIPTGSSVKLLESILDPLVPYHKITVYSVLITEHQHPNVTIVKLTAPPILNRYKDDLFDTIIESSPSNVLHDILTFTAEEYIDATLSSKEMQSLIHTTEKYDLILSYVTFSDFVFQFAHLFRIPLVQIAPTMLFPYSNDVVGNSVFQTSSYNTFNYETTFNFFSRLRVYINTMIHFIKYKYVHIPNLNKATKKYFPSDTPTIEEMHFNTSLWLTNVNKALGYVKPNMPHVLDIGGLFCRPSKPLGADLEEFISGAGDSGIIYVSFGTSIVSKFPDNFQNSLIKVFAKLPQRILWKWNDDIPNLPSNVRVSKWFNQQDILGHNKTKLFITQGGILSLQESVYHTTPVLMIPIIIDQPYNAYLANQLGYGEYIHFRDYSEEQFEYYIQEILSNPKYKENIIRISKLLKEEIKTVNDTLLNGINYVIQHNGNPIIQQVPNRLTGIQRMDVDIVIFLVIMFIFILFSVLYITSSIIKFVFRSFKFDHKQKIL